MKKVGINGFGRIGRLALRVIMEKYTDQIEVPIVNTSGKLDAAGWAHLFEFDTAYKRYKGKIEVDGDYMIVDGHKIMVTGQREPAKIPWDEYGVETVIESTGVFRKAEQMREHLRGSVSKVWLAAPAKSEGVETVVLGINDQAAQGKQLLSNASCTTNCVSPVTRVMLENFGVKKAGLTTIHSYTSDQNLHDGSHPDLRRARAAAMSMIPTTTGAAKATTKVIPQLKGLFDGSAIRVPTLTGSITDFTFLTEKPTTVEEVNQAFEKAANDPVLGKYLWVTKKPIVSSDVIGCEASALVDLQLTQVIDNDLVKVFAWYDNEWGFTNRLVEQVLG